MAVYEPPSTAIEKSPRVILQGMSPEQAAELEAVIHYRPALEALIAGETLPDAAKTINVTSTALIQTLAVSPRLYEYVKAMRDVLRDVNYVRAQAILGTRLNAKKNPKMTNRDLTDIIRSIKPPYQDPSANITIQVDL